MNILDGSAIRRHEWDAPVLTIGNFDGVHLGHRTIVERVVSRARRCRCAGVALTFEPHPKAVVHHPEAPPRLTPPEERNRRLAELSLDVLIVLEPTLEFLGKSPEDFIREIVVGALHASAIVEGPDFRFGRNTEGDLNVLQEMGKTYGFDVEVVPPVFCDGRMVSSTMIRSLLGLGQVDLAARALGRPYAVAGTVFRGKGRGRDLGFPTINLPIPDQMLPHPGVYVTEISWDGGSAFGMAYLGHPFAFGDDALVFEIHLFDFAGDLYGKSVSVEFLHRLRDEGRFATPEDLREQLLRDLEASRLYLAHRSTLSR